MKRWLWISVVLAFAVIVVAHETSRGQVPGGKPPADVGPGAGGATLKLPGMDPGPRDNASVPDSLKGLWKSGTAAYPAVKPGTANVAQPPTNHVDINKDIEITPAAGNWLIFAMAYKGPKAPEMARKFVAVMRGQYKWNAYVFNYGAEEKRKEYERVQKIRQEQIDALAKAGLKADVPIRVATVRVEEQTGVLVGGWKTRDEALKGIEKIRKLDPKILLENKIDLDTKFVVELDGKARREAVLVNPFLKAFLARNPSIAPENIDADPVADLKLLRHINEGEPFNLLKCNKPFTLAIKQFAVQFQTLQGDKEGKREVRTFLEKLEAGLLLKGKDWEDLTAHNAHRLAEALRKQGLPETFVLHTKHCSYVTIGAFDRPDDPRLLALQNHLETRLKTDFPPQWEFFPRPVVMQVPGVPIPAALRAAMQQSK